MRYILSVLLLCLLSGALSAQNFTVKQGEYIKMTVGFVVKQGAVPPAKVAPTEGRHSTTVCEEHGCGCGCLRGGACICHPGWEKSKDGWYYYRVRGQETGAFDSKTNSYWRKGADGKWHEWLDEVRETRQSLAPVYRSNVRRSGNC